jgi:sRNA-binding protein
MSYAPRLEPAAIVEFLAAQWPVCFTIDPRSRRPLKLGIHVDVEVAACGALTKREIHIALGWYVRGGGYLWRMRAGCRAHRPGRQAGRHRLGGRRPARSRAAQGPQGEVAGDRETGSQRRCCRDRSTYRRDIMRGIKTDTTPDREHDQNVIEARTRLERQVAKMALVIGAHDAATAYIAVGMTAFAAVYGREKAAELLRGCADELEDEVIIEGSA